MAVVFCAAAGIVSLIFFLVYGIGLTAAFVPRSWEVLQSKSYPNLHHLIFLPVFGDPNFVTLTLKQFRGALETLAFYLHRCLQVMASPGLMRIIVYCILFLYFFGCFLCLH